MKADDGLRDKEMFKDRVMGERKVLRGRKR